MFKTLSIILISSMLTIRCFGLTINEDSVTVEWDTSRAVSLNRFFKNDLFRHNKKDKKCRDNRSIWFKGDCQTFAFPSETFCKHGQVFLLEKPIVFNQSKTVTMKFICQEPKCPDVHMSWWEREQRCIVEYDERKVRCGDNAYILDNVFGEGECECFVTFGHLYEGSKCYEYYQQGPCVEGKVLVYDSYTTLGLCAPDQCRNKNIKSQESERRNAFVPLNGDGECVELGSKEGCPPSLREHFTNKVEIDHELNIPVCAESSSVYY